MRATDTVQLGRTNLRVTRLGLGTAPLGGLFREVEDGVAVRVVERAYELGLRLFDTAPLYGSGYSERRVGAALGQYPRDSYVLATKVGRLLRQGAPPDPTQIRDGQSIYRGTPEGVQPVFDFSADGIRLSYDESLQRLGLDRIDILHIHDPDDNYETALRDAYPVLADMRSRGVIGAVGAGMNQPEMPASFARAADFDCFLLAGRYTLLDQSGLDELLPLCAERGISVICGGTFNSGILANPSPGATYAYAPASEEILARAQRLQDICQNHDVPLAAAAIQFPMGHSAVASVVIGARSEQEIEQNVALFELPIPAALWAELKAEGVLAENVPVPESDA
ncbi:MAG TPA: aldo/keto reductase [Candidatus Dormibacteraeota bacterium]|nr:aldo/keto reductase [Candidatus Dormibacteraeota bacterium]